MSAMRELSMAVRSVGAAVSPAVVRIGQDGGRGCGIVVGPGAVLTNAHNLRGPQATVAFADGRTVAAPVAGVDVDGDVAVLAAETTGAPALPWAPAPPEVGDVVFAVARGASGAVRVTMGLLTATDRAFLGPRGRRIAGSVEHTAPLPRGSSGGPVVDDEGRLVGINTNRLGDGFYLALPADDVLRARIDALAAGHGPRRPTLGVGLAPAWVARRLRRSVGLADRAGVLVRAVEDGSPAAQAGVRPGDLIVAAAGRAVGHVDELYDALDAAAGDDSVTLGLVRGVDELEVQVILGGDEGERRPR